MSESKTDKILKKYFDNNHKDTIIALIFGFSLSIIGLIPDTIILPFSKLYLASSVAIISIIFVIITKFYGDLKEYRVLKQKFENYYQVIPCLVRFAEVEKIVNIKEKGSGNLLLNLKL